MFTARNIKKLMDAQPFRPFRLCMSDGKTYDIKHHDMALVTRNYIEVGINLDAKGIAEDIDRCSVLHITRIEDIQTA